MIPTIDRHKLRISLTSRINKVVAKFGYKVTKRGRIPLPLRVRKYRLDRDSFSLLSSELKTVVEWHSENLKGQESLTSTITGKIWKEIPEGHKWLDYFPIYDREFSHLRERKVSVLEIGVYRGASLKMWRQFFGPQSTIVGIDIDETCRKYVDTSGNIHVRIGSQADKSFLSDILREFGQFDLIIDDGSHFSSHQIASFNCLFLAGLKENGIYFIEDLENVYMGIGHLDQSVSAMDFLKMLVDMQNVVFLNRLHSDFYLNEGSVRESFSVPFVASLIDSIKFYRSVAVIQKSKVSPPYMLHL